MERTLLSGLSWRCQAPTAHQIVLNIFYLLPPYAEEIPEVTWVFLMDEVKDLTELAVRDYYFSNVRASTIALAALLNVIGNTTDRFERLLNPFLRVIVESFDFDHPIQIAAARRRLQQLTDDSTPDYLDDDDVMDECSFDISGKTSRVSNMPSQKKMRKTNFEGNEHEASPSCTLSLHQHHDFSCDASRLTQDLFFIDQSFLSTS